jgi:hypothetical protein
MPRAYGSRRYPDAPILLMAHDDGAMRVPIVVLIAAMLSACQAPAADPSEDLIATFDSWEAASDKRGWASISVRNDGFHTLTARCTVTVVSDVDEKSKRVPPLKVEPNSFFTGTRVSINVDGARTVDSGTIDCGSRRYPDAPSPVP